MNVSDYSAYKTVIETIKNARGENVFTTESQVNELFDFKATLNELKQLACYSDPAGKECFRATDILYALVNGYTLADLLHIAHLKNNADQPIFTTSQDINTFIHTKCSIDTLEHIVSLQDHNQTTLYSTADDVLDLIRDKTAALPLLVTTIHSLRYITSHVNERVFKTPRDITRFVRRGGNYEYAQALLALKDHDGKTIFDEFSLAWFKRNGGTPEYAHNLIALKDTDGKTLFSSGMDIVDFHRDIRPIGRAATYAAVLDHQKKTLFRDGRDLYNFAKTEATTGDAYLYSDITTIEGKPAFNGHDVALLKKQLVNPVFAQALAKQSLNAQTILYYFVLGKKEHEIDFQNHGKPKALIIYPTHDPPMFEQSNETIIKKTSLQDFTPSHTFTQTAIFTKLLHPLFTAYDTKIRAVSTLEEMKQHLSTAHDIDLLILGGHGTHDSLMFGESMTKYGITVPPSECKLTTKTTDIHRHLKIVKPNGAIFLHSCSNGKGRETSQNLANHIAQQAPDRKIVSCTEDFAITQLSIYTLYPFDALLTKQNEGRTENITYTIKT